MGKDYKKAFAEPDDSDSDEIVARTPRSDNSNNMRGRKVLELDDSDDAEEARPSAGAQGGGSTGKAPAEERRTVLDDTPEKRGSRGSRGAGSSKDKTRFAAGSRNSRSAGNAAGGGGSSSARPKRAAASRTKKWEEDFVISSSDGEVNVPAEKDDKDWGGDKSSSEEEDEEGDEEEEEASDEERTGKARSPRKREGKRGAGARKGDGHSTGKKPTSKKIRLSEEEAEEEEQAHGEDSGHELSTPAQRNRRGTARTRAEQAQKILSVKKTLKTVLSDEGGDQEEGGAAGGRSRGASGKKEESSEDEPLVTPRRSGQKASAASIERRYGGSGSGAQSSGRLFGEDYERTGGSARRGGAQILAKKQIVVCPHCYRHLESEIPGLEPGQRLPANADANDPLDVILRRGRSRLSSFIFPDAREFRAHLRDVHRQSETPETSQHYLKQLVYNFLTASNRERNYQLLSESKNKGDRTGNWDSSDDDGVAPTSGAAKIQGDTNLVQRYWGEDEHARAHTYNDVVNVVVQRQGNLDPLFSDVSDVGHASESESDINDFIADDDEEESEDSSSEEDRRKKKGKKKQAKKKQGKRCKSKRGSSRGKRRRGSSSSSSSSEESERSDDWVPRRNARRIVDSEESASDEGIEVRKHGRKRKRRSATPESGESDSDSRRPPRGRGGRSKRQSSSGHKRSARVVSDSDEEEERGVDEGQAGAGGFVVDEWVQCESCSKWRRLPGDGSVDTRGVVTCSMLKGWCCGDPEEPEHGGAGGAAGGAATGVVGGATGGTAGGAAGGAAGGSAVKRRRVLEDSDEDEAQLSAAAAAARSPRKAHKGREESKEERRIRRAREEALRELDLPMRGVANGRASDEDGSSPRASRSSATKGRGGDEGGSLESPGAYKFRARRAERGGEEPESSQAQWRAELKARNRAMLAETVEAKRPSSGAKVVVLTDDEEEGSIQDFIVEDSDGEADNWQDKVGASRDDDDDDARLPRRAGAEEGGADRAGPLEPAGPDDAIFAAAAAGDAEAVRAVLRRTPGKARLRQNGRAVLHEAARFGQTGCVKELVAAGADVNGREDSAGMTPLLLALQDRHVDTALWLLEKGASVSLHDKDGTLPLHMAAAACDATVLKKVVAVMARTDRRTMTDVRDQRGQQAMHYAAGEGNLEVMRVLVSKHNASIRAADNEGITPLLVAAMSGQATSIRPLVVELGADPHEADDAGMTALHHAAANGHVECIAALVDLGANVDAELPSGTRLTAGASPLHLAACEGHAACVSELVRRGARVETRDKQGWTALLYADFCRNRQCIVEMLQPNNVEVCATQLSNLGRLLQSDRGETCERVRKVIEYAATVPEFYQAINRHVADNLSALEGHMSFLLSNKALLNFANKHAWFLRRLQPSRDFGGYSWAQVDECRLAVDRQDLAGSALLALQALTPEQLRAPHLRVLWADEEGAGTGPVREFFAAAPAALVDPARGLFVAIDGRAHHPAPAPAGEAAQAVHRANMTAFGRLVGLGLRHDYLVDVRFSSTFLWLLLARSVKDPFEGLPRVAALDAKLARLQDLDPALHKSLTWLLEEEGALEMLGATVFAISEDCPAPPPAPPAGGGAQDAMVIADSDDEGAEGAEVGGRAEDKGQEGGQDPPAASQCSPGAGAGAGTKAQGGVREVELVKGGAQKQVTSANVREYVDAYATYKLVGSVRGQMLAFRKGLAEAVGADALGLFLEDEAELLVAGLPEIDAREWRRHARYSGASLDAPLSAASQLAEWFWEIVEALDQGQRALLLKFATGSTRVPPSGFAHLPGLGSECCFTLSCVGGGDERLPTASTCFNLLKVPDYSSKEVFEDRLFAALHYGAEGFTFN